MWKVERQHAKEGKKSLNQTAKEKRSLDRKIVYRG